VLIYTGAATGLGFGHEGDGEFAVESHGSYGRELLASGSDVSEVSALVPSGTVIVTIRAGGEWTLTPR
jgi:hypothetical protein